MGIRFRRKIRLLPGVHLNLSGSGVSLSAGPRGASVTLGINGAYLNLRIPGTGLYSRKRITGGGIRNQRKPSSESEAIEMSVSVTITDEGEVRFTDSDGDSVDNRVVCAIRKQRRTEIRALMMEYAAKINQAVTSATDIHLATPPADQPLVIEPSPFTRPKPQRPQPITTSLFAKLFRRKCRAEIEQRNCDQRQGYLKAFKAWKHLKSLHDTAEKERIATLLSALRSDVEVMEHYLEQSLKTIRWPWETLVSFEIMDSGRTVAMDVDLPEIEDLPVKTANVPQRGWKVVIKTLSDRQKRLNYARHIHGILFRLVGETFTLLPSVEQVLISGYSQRPSPKTGKIEDDYLVSVRVRWETWTQIDFANLKDIDPVEAMGNFEVRRHMTKTGIFKPIEFSSPSAQ